MKKNEKNKEVDDDNSTIDEIEINKIIKINKIEEKDEGINYELSF